ncbi:type II toxin-antitoxin system HipA family toxin [Herbaspirillum sp. HC18]|nr:type II toxin-antitoxin system HipA family toxin [Herbaspirillum sp. HC18]
MQVLNAWMNGELVGHWRVDRQSHSFQYAPSWLDSPHRRSLSLSLPISAALEIKGEAVKNYFDNLLPDNDKIRARLGKRFKAKSTDTFDLLRAIGRDCIGAVQLLPEDAAPGGWDRIEGESLSENELEELLHAVPSEAVSRFGDDEFFRISIAGAQEKTALLFWNGKWCRPHGATPTTHIIKLPLGLIGGSRRVDAGDSIHNEWLCARIVQSLGLPAAETSIARFGDQTVLAVERFDREWRNSDNDSDTWIARIPQEDFCQALGVPPDRKYEIDGGPGMRECIKLLQGSVDKDDPAFFLLTQLAFFLLAAPDGHAKNYSIYLHPGDLYEMTPLYDVLSMWPYYGDGNNQFKRRKAGPAMAIRSKNVHTLFHTIETRHWHALALKNGGLRVWEAMLKMVESAEEALADVEAQLPDDFPARTWEKISAGVKDEAQRFLAGAAAFR